MTKQHKKVLDENLSFESLLGELSAKLVNLPLESIDSAIESSMKKLVEFFEAYRCHLGKFSDDQSKIIVPYFYSRPSVNISQTKDVGDHYLSFVFESIRKDKLIAFANPSEFPDHAKQDRTMIEKLGVKSLLVLPLKIDNDVNYTHSLANVRRRYPLNKAYIH